MLSQLPLRVVWNLRSGVTRLARSGACQYASGTRVNPARLPVSPSATAYGARN